MSEKPTLIELEKSVRELEPSDSNRKQTEAHLELFKKVVESATDAIGISTPEGQHWYQNSAFDALFGEIGEDPPSTLYCDEKVGREVFEAIMAGGEWSGEVQMYATDGRVLDILLRAYAVTDETGKIQSLVGVHTDVSDSRRSQELFKMVAQSTSDVFYEWNVQTDSLQWFSDIEAELGYATGEVPPTIDGWINLIHPEDRPQLAGAVEEHRTSTKSINYYYRVKHKNGTWRYWHDHGTPVLDSQGRPVRWVGGITDITERKQTEKTLRESEQRFRDLIESTSDWVWEVDQEGVYTYSSPKVKEFLGYEPKEVVGKTPFDFMPSEEAKRVSRIFNNFVTSKAPFISLENTNLHQNGDIVIMETSGVPFFSAEGAFLGFRGIDRDITERKQIEEELRKSEIKHRTLIKNIPGMVYRAYKDWSAEIISGCEKISGYTSAELNRKEKNWLSVIHPDDIEEVFKEGHRLSKEAKDLIQTYRILTKDGEVRWIEDHKASLFSEEGEFLGIDGIVFDVTGRKQTEVALKQSEERYRRIFENSAFGFFQSTPEGQFVKVNPAFAGMLGYESPECLVSEITDIATQYYVNPEDRRQYQHVLHKNGKVENYEFRAKRKEGTQIWVSNSTRAHFNPDGRIIHYEGIVIDITKRKIFEKELQDLNETMILAQKMAGMGYWSYDLKTGRRIWSDQMFEVFGCDPQLGPPGNDELKKIWNPDDWHVYRNSFQDALAGKPYNIVNRIKFPDGQTHFIDTQGHPRYDDDGNITGLYGTSRDITKQKIAHQALKESEEKFRTLVEQSPLGISLIGRDGRYKYVNPGFHEIFGYTIEDVPTGLDWFEKAFPVEDYRKKVIKTWKEDQRQAEIGYARPRVYTVVCKDGSRKEVHFRPVTMESIDQFVLYEDVTTRLKMEQQLQQAQRFEAIGTLAGGVAHDFNNLLMGIQGRASLISVDLDHSSQHLEHVNAIDEYIKSATNLTKQLLGFARGGKYEVKPTDINELVHNSADMFGRTKKEIRIHTSFQAPPPVAAADRNQIEHALLNLFINAWQAMPGGGKLYLETQTVTLNEAYCKPYNARPGQYVKISVTDTGRGMDEATCPRIFDPFFTTKDKSYGTGLGLASTYGIVKNHGGIITVYSEVGRGTTFNIHLPASDIEAYRQKRIEGKLVEGNETVLIVDDEKMIIEVGQAMLERLGYRVFVANSGRQAVEAISEADNEIDLVILDMIMPEMDGAKTYEHIKRIQPEMPVLLSSGYAINGQATEIMERGCNGFIQKPFNISELSQKIRTILDRADSNNRS